MPIETIFRNVEFAAHEPLRERRFPFQNFFPRRAPDQLTRFACPEFSGLVDRLSIHPPILIEVFDPCLLCEILRWFENALLDQMRFDVVVHEQSLICRRDLFGKRSVPPSRSDCPQTRTFLDSGARTHPATPEDS